MDKQKVVSSLRFINYTVNKVEFEQNKKYVEKEDGVSIDFDIVDNIVSDKNKMIVTLKLNIFKDMLEKAYPFRLYVEIQGFFETAGNDIDTFKANAIAILYPYLRSTVSIYTSNSNISTLILPPINVVSYLENKKKDKEEK